MAAYHGIYIREKKRADAEKHRADELARKLTQTSIFVHSMRNFIAANNLDGEYLKYILREILGEDKAKDFTERGA